METLPKIEVVVCKGTACFVMGGALFSDLKRFIPAKYKSLVQVTYKPCLGLCSEHGFEFAPFVMIDGQIVTKATVDKILLKIEEKILAGE